MYAYSHTEGRMKKILNAAGIILIIIVLIVFGFAISVLFMSKGDIKDFLDENGNIVEGSMAERTFIEIGGRQNGMIIRGKNVENPVLLFISGGPGVPEYWLNEYYENKMEEYFTVCWWDYYGEGLSYDSSLRPENVTLEKLESDAVEVSEYLKERFGKEKVYLMAHSGGTMLGMRIAADCPENFYCYFAMAQECGERHIAGYPYLKEYFEKNNLPRGLKLINRHVKEENGELIVYNYDNIESDWEKALLMAGCATTREMRSDALEVFFPQIYSKCYKMEEKINFWRGKALCQNSAYAVTEITVDKEKPLMIPIYFISGRYDYTCPVNLVAELYQNISAPEKEMYIFEDSAHSPLWEENEATLEVMLKHVK